MPIFNFKGFKCAGVEGRDVVQMLQEAIHRRNDVEIDVLAVLNEYVIFIRFRKFQI